MTSNSFSSASNGHPIGPLDPPPVDLTLTWREKAATLVILYQESK